MSLERLTTFVCFSVLLESVSPVGHSAAAQSLADVARKEEARRKTIADPAKVYTNKDLKPVPAPSSAAAPEPKTGEKPAAEKDSSTPADTGAPEKTPTATNEPVKDAVKDAVKDVVKDRAYWAARLKALQEQLARDETYVDALQSRVNGLLTEFVNRDDPAQKNAIEQNRLKAIAEMDRLKQAIPNDKKAINDLLEEARRAGVPPGWLR